MEGSRLAKEIEMVSQNVTLGPVREVWLPAGGVLANLLSGNDRRRFKHFRQLP